LLIVCAVLLSACAKDVWQGFENEDLTRYLTLGQYKGLAFTAYDTKATEEEIRDEIRMRLEAITPLTPTEEPIAEGTIVTLDRFCFLNGVSTPSLSEEGGTYRVGTVYEDAAIQGLLSQLLGKTLGDTAELTVTLPADYVADGSPATEAVYRVTVRALFLQHLPDLTDAVAATLMKGVKTVDELKTAIRGDLEKVKKEEASYRIEAELWDKLMADSVLIARPSDLYHGYYRALYVKYEDLAAASTMELDAYLGISLGITEEELQSDLAEQAEEETKMALVLHSVAKAEGITYTAEEVKAYADRCAKEGSLFESGVEYLDFYGEETVTHRLLKEKIIAFMIDNGRATA
jgi:trigger factor